MASTKAVQVLFNNTTLTAAAGDQTSTTALLTDNYSHGLLIKITNGATGPTVAAQAQVWASMDNSNFYKMGGALISTLGNAVVTSWTMNLPAWAMYAYVTAGSNTGQNVTVRAEAGEVSELL